ncbi:hypothetical protein KUCAC02_003598, partial [Chaenocephalus aceratus]
VVDHTAPEPVQSSGYSNPDHTYSMIQRCSAPIRSPLSGCRRLYGSFVLSQKARQDNVNKQTPIYE